MIFDIFSNIISPITYRNIKILKFFINFVRFFNFISPIICEGIKINFLKVFGNFNTFISPFIYRKVINLIQVQGGKL